jgi:2-deoxy-D-gluconate 3-dehydrogenase
MENGTDERLFSLQGRRALVTGASRGIGRTLAIALARSGAEVLLTARSTDDLAKVQRDIQASGGAASTFPCDVASTQEIQLLFRDLRDRELEPDILINNAGVIHRTPPEHLVEADWDRVLNVNLKGAFFVAQQAGIGMIRSGYGKIINITSILAFAGGAQTIAYATSKGGVTSMTKALAVAWARHGIRVNAIAPGYTATELTEALYQDDLTRNTLTNRIPLGRWAKTDDLVGAAIFLASSASDYVTGHTLVVDGGWMAA